MTSFRDIEISYQEDNVEFNMGLDEAGMDLKGDEGLRTAVIISLFTDRRVPQASVPQLQTSRRGWWGDMVPDVEGDRIGSRLWTLERSKLRDTAIENGPLFQEAEGYCLEALRWLIDDGVAQTVEVNVTFDETTKIPCIETIITRPSGESSRFDIVWDAEESRT